MPSPSCRIAGRSPRAMKAIAGMIEASVVNGTSRAPSWRVEICSSRRRCGPAPRPGSRSSRPRGFTEAADARSALPEAAGTMDAAPGLGGCARETAARSCPPDGTAAAPDGGGVTRSCGPGETATTTDGGGSASSLEPGSPTMRPVDHGSSKPCDCAVHRVCRRARSSRGSPGSRRLRDKVRRILVAPSRIAIGSGSISRSGWRGTACPSRSVPGVVIAASTVLRAPRPPGCQPRSAPPAFARSPSSQARRAP